MKRFASKRPRFWRASAIAALTVAAVAVVTVSIADAIQPVTTDWTAVGSSGAVRPQDLSRANVSGAQLQIPSSVASGNVTAIYNVVAVAGLTPGTTHNWALTARYQDNGAGSQVVFNLKKTNLATGATSTLITLDSNNFTQQAGVQEQSSSNQDQCLGPVNNFSFDFGKNVYYVEAVMTKSASDGAPIVSAVTIQNSGTCIH
jgi:hypothetical protein